MRFVRRAGYVLLLLVIGYVAFALWLSCYLSGWYHVGA